MNEPLPQQPQGESVVPTPADRNWAVGAHLGAALAWLVGSWLLNVLIPLVVMLVQSDRPFAREQAKEALNFQISLLIYFTVGLIASFMTLGIGLLVFIPVALLGAVVSVILGIVAAITTSRGEHYRYPLTIRLVS
jgi:uncharacterized Tic20 family protein